MSKQSLLLQSIRIIGWHGHAGSAAIKSQAKNIVFGPHIGSYIEEIAKNCTECFTSHIPKRIFVSKWPETN